ncbi:hypothetical protein [Streptomyces sp. A0592]|uniref:hypothetical protein n=1 Tax=Streptomyces sp. A0592 TaxID=2563099 RepID=UPI00109EB91C|nr:hypothetical protein [Streptomyces sp. A0592]THA86954.1 hypothetical protein E6U81_02495 [Streptomyces sp. A0592]
MADWPAVQPTERTDTIVRRKRGRTVLGSLAMAAVLTATATACGGPFQDLGPLPPRFSGPPLPADAVVSEMTSVLAAEGITVGRQPSEVLGRCTERLMGRHAPGTVDSALKAAVERARSEHGWQAGPELGSGTLTLTKGNWTALTALPSPDPGRGIESVVIVSLTCVNGGSPTATTPSAPAPTPS